MRITSKDLSDLESTIGYSCTVAVCWDDKGLILTAYTYVGEKLLVFQHIFSKVVMNSGDQGALLADFGRTAKRELSKKI